MVQSYILSKYNVGVAPTLDAPTFSLPGALVTPGQVLSLAQDQAQQFTSHQDGSTPTTTEASQWFASDPIVLNSSRTIKAVASAPFYTDSPDCHFCVHCRRATHGVPRDGLMLWLRSDLNVTSSSGFGFAVG